MGAPCDKLGRSATQKWAITASCRKFIARIDRPSPFHDLQPAHAFMSRQDPYAVRLAVRYIEDAVAADENAVRPRQRAVKRVGLGTVTSTDRCR